MDFLLDKRTRAQMLAHCGEIHADDGVDPREYFKAGRIHKKEDHKAKQLCRQVAETLDQVLPGETSDDVRLWYDRPRFRCRCESAP